MSEDAVSQLLKQFTQQVLDQVKGQGERLTELLRSVDKISGKQDQIEQKLDDGQTRFEIHEQVHNDLGRRLNELESDRKMREHDQTRIDRLIKGGWAVLTGLGAGALGVATYILDKHK